MSLAEQRLTEFMDTLASGAPTPGGGSAAALGGAMGAALAEMVCNLTLGKDAYADVQEEVSRVQAACREHRRRLISLVDEDASAFDQVMVAFKMPKGEERSSAIQVGYRKAASVPLETARHCLGVLEQAATIARIGNRNSITDAGVSALMAHAALHAALLNVKINLSGIRDRAFVEETTDLLADMEDRATRKLRETQELVHEAL
ncbi:MAG TPA: methenyltetrahydrofolate cyclohydrolase [Thermoplasmatales archaeon]|nr:methenyltetrahydrofolate cyclohydrolase [Thermoplasmatales archaeon]